jgi:DNA-binding TFAR19-related protein (PDSD5 family)
MIATLQMFFFGVLACSTFVATILMAINFPRIRAANQAVMMILNSLADTHRVTYEIYDAKLNQLEERLQELERHEARG